MRGTHFADPLKVDLLHASGCRGPCARSFWRTKLRVAESAKSAKQHTNCPQTHGRLPRCRNLIKLLSDGPLKLPAKHKRPIDGVQLARVSVQDFGCVRGIDPEWALALRFKMPQLAAWNDDLPQDAHPTVTNAKSHDHTPPKHATL